MKNLLTTEQLRLKYDPESILKDIDANYEKHLEKLRGWIFQEDNPINNYNTVQQISFLETNDQKDTNLINELLTKLKDTVYFMGLSKKERLVVTQKMRGFYSGLITNYLKRINVIMSDPELLSPKQFNDPIPKHRGIEIVFEILKIISKDLELESKYRKNMPRAGHLTCFQISMGGFLKKLEIIGMSQKNRITLVQQLFHTFKVDWKEGDRENIKLSLLKPSTEYYERAKVDIQNLSNYHYPESLGDNLISNMINQAIIFKKRIRRF